MSNFEDVSTDRADGLGKVLLITPIGELGHAMRVALGGPDLMSLGLC